MKEMLEKIFNKDNLIPLFFMVLPFMIMLIAVPYGKGVTIHISHKYALFIFTVVMAIGFIKNKFISAFLVYASAWTLFILLFTVKHPEVPQAVTKNAFDSLSFLLFGVVLYALVIKSRIKQDVFYNVICISALIQAAIAFCQFIWIDPYLWAVSTFFHKAVGYLNPSTMTGTLGNNNFLAAYLAISMPLFFRQKWIYGLFVIVPCLILCNTTAAIVAAIVGTVYFFARRETFTKRKLYCGVALIVFGLYYAFVYHPSILYTGAESRWLYWGEAAKQIFYSPLSILIGYGTGSGWGYPFPMHNEWLQCWHQYGLIGLSLLIGYVLTVYRDNRILFSAFLIILVNMLGNYPLHLAPSAFLIIIIAGLMEREKEYGGY
jgi:hypothetical protein